VPESPKWLALHGVAPDAARRSVEALGIIWPQRVAIVAAVDIPRPSRRIGLRNFQGGADIYLMWVVFFCLLTLGYLNVNWIPTVLVKAGFGIKQASFAAAGYNIGGIAGGIVASFFVNRYGSRVLIGVAAVGAAAAFVPAFLMSFHELGYGWLLSIIVFQGICIVAVNAPALAIVAYMHSTSTRATGVALAVGLGRTGAIGSSFLGAEIVHQAHGGPLYFQVVLVLLIVSSIALAMVGRHLKPAPVC
jgi:AAHS family 4-hydroxybenzoate transporter-like MFS transporter